MYFEEMEHFSLMTYVGFVKKYCDLLNLFYDRKLTLSSSVFWLGFVQNLNK